MLILIKFVVILLHNTHSHIHIQQTIYQRQQMLDNNNYLQIENNKLLILNYLHNQFQYDDFEFYLIQLQRSNKFFVISRCQYC
jgi:hypothetical protein